MKKIVGIYIIKNNINNNFYIGSSKNIKNRWSVHKSKLKMNKHDNIHLQRSYNLYGKDSFSYSIIEETTIEDLLIKEQDYLNKYNNDDLCYNIGLKCVGGDNLTKHPNRQNIIDKIKKSLKNRFDKLSNDDKKLIYGKYGDDNPNYNKKWTDDMKNQASERTKKYYTYNVHPIKNKRLEDFYGIEKAKEMKKKISEHAKTKLLDKNPFYNKHHSEETKEILRKKRIGKYYGKQNIPFIIDDVEYETLSSASKKLGIHPTTISWRLKSKNKKFENYKYKD
jgi:group I intron endonuclease